MPAKGPEVVERNFAAVDDTLAHLHQVAIPAGEDRSATIRCHWRRVAASLSSGSLAMLAGRGDLIPVSMLPVDGTYPTATSRFEKRDIAREVPIWHSDICIQCGNCVFVCPHGALRAKFYHPGLAGDRPEAAQSVPVTARGFPDSRYIAALSGRLHRLRPVRAGLSGADRGR